VLPPQHECAPDRRRRNRRRPAKNDGRVVVRLLLNNGIRPVAGCAKVAKYAAEYAAKLEGKATR